MPGSVGEDLIMMPGVLSFPRSAWERTSRLSASRQSAATTEGEARGADGTRSVRTCVPTRSVGTRIAVCTLAMLVTALAASPVLASEHWPGWRGPTGMGLSDETGLPLTWGGKEQTNVRWKVPLFPSDKVKRDQNQSSPIVWGDRVFVTVSYWPEGTTEKNFPEHHLLCFQ